jgi:hypothetical protein
MNILLATLPVDIDFKENKLIIDTLVDTCCPTWLLFFIIALTVQTQSPHLIAIPPWPFYDS